MEYKACAKCRQTYPVEHFDRKSKERRHARCKKCRAADRVDTRAQRREYERANHDRIRNNRLHREFGITSAKYEELFAYQGKICAICGTAKTRHRLAVDHDHATGKIRGLLCDECNLKLEHFVTHRQTILAYLAHPPFERLSNGHSTKAS